MTAKVEETKAPTSESRTGHQTQSLGFLPDTCIWVDIERGVLTPQDVAEVTGDFPVYLSPIILAEMSYGAEAASKEALRQRRLAALNRLATKPVLPIDGSTGRIFGTLAAVLKKQGRGHDFRVQDLWIASQAIQHNLTLLTHNIHDFVDIPGLALVSIQTK